MPVRVLRCLGKGGLLLSSCLVEPICIKSSRNLIYLQPVILCQICLEFSLHTGKSFSLAHLSVSGKPGCFQ